MNKHFALAACAAILSTSASAADWTLTDIKLDSIAVIAAPVGAHKAGNVEIAVTYGFALPTGFRCTDNYRLTTLKTTDPDRALLGILEDIKIWGKGSLTFTDDPALTAYPGRCSVRAAQR